ncbi:MAG: acetyl-CoA carboxylase biotin carboxyl carrier protein [Candidatus Limnocylindria bacterium]
MTDAPVTPDEHAVLAAVDALAPAFEQAGLDEVEVEVGELRVRLARPRAVAPADPPTPSAAPAAVVASAGDGLTPFGEPTPGMRHVIAPLTGVWYASPSPGARAYVAEGGEITSGQVVGLIEAMKLFNEIKSDVSGTVTRALVESGTLVKRKQPLLEVKPA